MNGEAQSRLRVLVVDESQAMRRELRRILEPLAEVSVVGMAQNAEAALDLFFHYRPDVMVVSICLPDRNGFEVLDCVRQAEPNCAVIIMTKQPNPCIEQSGRLLGAAAVCPKSGGFVELREVVRWLATEKSGREIEGGRHAMPS